MNKAKYLLSKSSWSRSSDEQDLVDMVDESTFLGTKNTTASSVDHADSDPKVTEIRLYPIRWYLLIVMSLCNMLTSIFQMSFSSIQKETLTHFGMEYSDGNKRKINLFSLLYNINVVFAFLVSYLIKRFGFAIVMDFGIACNLLGGWIRFGSSFWKSEYGFWLCFAGQLISSFSQSTISYSGTLFSSNWFGANERGISTTVTSFANLFGSGVAFSLNTMVGEGREWMISVTLLIHAILATAAAIAGIPFLRSNPPTPASISSANLVSRKTSFFSDIVSLVTNVNAIILLITFTLGFGSVCSFLTLISQITAPKGYDGTIASIIGLLIIFSGGLGAFISGVLVAKTKRFKLFMWIAGIGGLVSLGIFTFIIRFERSIANTIGLFLSSSMLGFFVLPFVPLVMELACEITYPVAANLSQTAFGSAGTGSIIAFVLILQELKSSDGSMQNAVYVILGSFALALVVFIFFRGKPKRSMIEAEIQNGKNGMNSKRDSGEEEDYYVYN